MTSLYRPQQSTCRICGAKLLPDERYRYEPPFVAPLRRCPVHGYAWEWGR